MTGSKRAERTYGPYRDADGARTYVRLTITDIGDGKTRVSFTGEEYPKHSHYSTAFGQHQGSAPAALIALWDRWHLNDMQAGCDHQRALGWTLYDEHPSEPCPTCGYRFGSAWLYEEPPADLLELCDAAASA